jgi:hypothetical protein
MKMTRTTMGSGARTWPVYGGKQRRLALTMSQWFEKVLTPSLSDFRHHADRSRSRASLAAGFVR